MKTNRNVGMRRVLSVVGAASVLAAALSFGVTPSLGETPKMSMGIPAIPPVFVGVQAMVAEKQGFFAKYGLDVKVRPFANGSEASRAVVAG
ncbi:MAG: ABC transporter substrate-binding protein, partial [Acidobacteriota bacterium]